MPLFKRKAGKPLWNLNLSGSFRFCYAAATPPITAGVGCTVRGRRVCLDLVCSANSAGGAKTNSAISYGGRTDDFESKVRNSF